MTKSILLIVAGTTIGTAAVALPALDLTLPAPAAARRPRRRCSRARVHRDVRRLGRAAPRRPSPRRRQRRGSRSRRPCASTNLRTPGAPVATIDATAALAPEGDDAEVDLEGLTRFGSRFALIGSHSLKGDDGTPAPSRRRLMAFALSGTAPRFTLDARPARYAKLVDDAQAFLADARPEPMQVLRPRQAQARREVGGLSIEALSASGDAGRAAHRPAQSARPRRHGDLLSLTNAAAVLDAQRDAGLRRADPAVARQAGPAGSRQRRAGRLSAPGRRAGRRRHVRAVVLGRTGRRDAAAEVRDIPNETDTSAEAIVVTPDGKSAWILFDEGERKTASGKKCKGDSVPPGRQVVPRPPRRISRVLTSPPEAGGPSGDRAVRVSDALTAARRRPRARRHAVAHDRQPASALLVEPPSDACFDDFRQELGPAGPPGVDRPRRACPTRWT